MRITRRSLLVGAAGLAAAGCAVKPLDPSVPAVGGPSSAHSGSAAGASSVPTSTPTPSPSPARTAPAGSALVAGTNHAAVATPYVSKAADLHRLLRGGPARAGDPSKVAFLTFDDGPNNVMTGPMLDTLKKLGVPASFFYIAGPTALGGAQPAVVARTLAEGHSIVVHSYSHDYKYLYPGRVGNVTNIMADLDKALAAIRGVVGSEYRVHGFRYPGGHMSWKGLDAADAALAARDMWWLDWNCMSGDAEAKPPKTVDAMVAMLSSTLAASGNPGVAVMLNHDSTGAALTKAALPAMVALLKSRGYTFGVID